MFTGLVEDIGSVVSVARKGAGLRLQVRSRIPMQEVQLGDSIAVNGVCLTADETVGDTFFAVVGAETVRKTNLGSLRASQSVHLERALRLGDRLGGHMVQGHVDGVGRLASIARERESVVLWVDVSEDLVRYCVNKGSVCLDGVSLTINDVAACRIRLNVVPHTASTTRLAGLHPGAVVNVEVDILAKYVERLIGGHSSAGVDLDMLRRTGFAK